MKKRSFLLIVLTFALFIFAGCAKDNEKVLKIAAFKGGHGDAYWAELEKKFEAKHEGLDVVIESSSTIETTLRGNLQAGNAPDIISLATGREEALVETLIKDRGIEDITDVMNKTVPGESKKVKDKILPGFLATTSTNPYNDGKTYLAPLFYNPVGL